MASSIQFDPSRTGTNDSATVIRLAELDRVLPVEEHHLPVQDAAPLFMRMGMPAFLSSSWTAVPLGLLSSARSIHQDAHRHARLETPDDRVGNLASDMYQNATSIPCVSLLDEIQQGGPAIVGTGYRTGSRPAEPKPQLATRTPRARRRAARRPVNGFMRGCTSRVGPVTAKTMPGHHGGHVSLTSGHRDSASLRPLEADGARQPPRTPQPFVARPTLSVRRGTSASRTRIPPDPTT